MIGLLKFELYKIFKKKSTIIGLIFFMIIFIVAHMFMVNKERKNYVYEEFQGEITEQKMQIAKEWKKTIDEEYEKLLKLHEEYKEKKIPEENLDSFIQKEGIIYSTINWNESRGNRIEVEDKYKNKNSVMFDILNMIKYEKDKKQWLYDVQKNLKTIENKGSFDYKEYTLLFDMVSKIRPFEIYDYTGWRNTINFIESIGFIIISTLILLGISPVFNEEYNEKMDSLILSSTYGKNKVITAKVLAACIYTTIVVLIFLGLNFYINYFTYGLHGSSSPIQSIYNFITVPFEYTLSQYYIRRVLICILGANAYALLTLLISTLNKGSIASFFIGGIFIIVPVFIRAFLGISDGKLGMIIDYSYFSIISGIKLVSSKYIDIFGIPVLYLDLMLFIFSLISIAIVYLTYKRFRNHQVV
jgi:hypothetical protein